MMAMAMMVMTEMKAKLMSMLVAKKRIQLKPLILTRIRLEEIQKMSSDVLQILLTL